MLAILESDKPKPPPREARITQYGVRVDVNETLDAMLPHQSFVVDTNSMRKHILQRGKDKGMKLTSKKEGERYRIHIK